MSVRGCLRRAALAVAMPSAAVACMAQAIPTTAGETLSGKPVVPAELMRGQTTILVAGFSHDAGMQSAAWRKAVHVDSALKGLPVYELAMLEKAPAIIRGMIQSGMRKGVPAAEQDQIIVMTRDEKLWEKFFGVENDKDPYVVLLDARGNVLWHGHGPAEKLEPLLKGALKQ